MDDRHQRLIGMPIRRVALGAMLACGLVLTGCATERGTSTGTGGRLIPPASCALSSDLVPSCGLLWGVATRPQTVRALAAVQGEVRSRFQLVYDYHDINDVLPNATELAEVKAGHVLHLAIAARIYGRLADTVTYRDIAAGRYDVDLLRQATGVASLHVPVFLTFEQEANQHTKLGPQGTAAEFTAAWRHIHDLYARAGASNAVWVWVMTGAAENLHRAGLLWPGNDYVDWISWNVYNQSGCGSGRIQPDLYTSFEAAMRPFYDWVHRVGPGLGIDPGKPMMLSEVGSVLYDGDPGRTARWYAQIPETLTNFPQIKAVSLWDSSTSAACNYMFQRNRAVVNSVRNLGINFSVTSS